MKIGRRDGSLIVRRALLMLRSLGSNGHAGIATRRNFIPFFRTDGPSVQLSQGEVRKERTVRTPRAFRTSKSAWVRGWAPIKIPGDTSLTASCLTPVAHPQASRPARTVTPNRLLVRPNITQLTDLDKRAFKSDTLAFPRLLQPIQIALRAPAAIFCGRDLRHIR